MRSVKFMRAAKTSYIVLSALYCVFGVLLIAVPDFSMKLLGILVGCMMIGFGAVKLMGYFSAICTGWRFSSIWPMGSC